MIFEEESPHTPLLIRQRVNDAKTCGYDTLVDRVDFAGLVDAHTDQRVTRCSGVLRDGLHLRGWRTLRRKIADPAQVHADIEIEQMSKQLIRAFNISDGHVGHDPGDSRTPIIEFARHAQRSASLTVAVDADALEAPGVPGGEGGLACLR